MIVGLDVMGGDNAPVVTIKGAVLAKKELPTTDKIALIGDKKVILELLEEEKSDPAEFCLFHAPDVIGMGESPARAFLQKPRSSISVGYNLLKRKIINAYASAGSSGAMLAGSIYTVNTIQGIIRPCTTAIVPKIDGGVVIFLDVGTIPDAKPDVLYQFGILGSVYAKYVHNIKNPKVGLLNIGEEEKKGNLVAQSTFQLMKNSKDFNFIGNVEGRDFFKNKTDVIVCDGYSGNVILKLLEEMYFVMHKRGLTDDYFERYNYENYGGTPILGINGSVVLGHGISNDIAIKNMIVMAKNVHEANLSLKIKKALFKFSQRNGS